MANGFFHAWPIQVQDDKYFQLHRKNEDSYWIDFADNENKVRYTFLFTKEQFQNFINTAQKFVDNELPNVWE